jgi:hypothetical protein
VTSGWLTFFTRACAVFPPAVVKGRPVTSHSAVSPTRAIAYPELHREDLSRRWRGRGFLLGFGLRRHVVSADLFGVNCAPPFQRASVVTRIGVGPPGISHSGPPMNPFEIRLLVRAKLCDGRLPLEVSATAVGRPGSEQKCGACDEVMPGNLLMIEISSGNT